MAAAADELSLLERVFLRIGSAETDEQLQNAVSKFLPPVLLKLSSQQEGVRKKVMELLIHINKRIKSRSMVQLPVEALLLQYQDPAASSFVTNFTIIYIKMGFPRLPLEKQAELVPSVLNSLEGKPLSHQDSLLMLIIPLLGHVKVPADPVKRSALFGLNEKPHISKQLTALILDMLLLPYGSSAQSTAPSANPDQASGSDVAFPVPPGMSQYTFKRVTADNPLKPEDLEKIKLGIVKFLAHGVFPDADVLLHLIVAAADTRFSVANLADLELKKIIGGLDWGSSALSMNLYRLFLGSQSNVKAENKKCPASTRIRLKVLHYLCKVKGAGFIIPLCMQVIFDSLYGLNTNTRLKTLALNFSTNLIQQADIKDLTPVGSLLLCGLTKLTDEGEPVHQAQAYIIIGLIGRRLPNLVCFDLPLLEKLFKKLVSESHDVRLQIREGMLNLVASYRYEGRAKVKESHAVMLNALLTQFFESDEPMVRFVAVRFLATVFPANHVPSKYLLLLATGDSKDDVATEASRALYESTFKKEAAKPVLPAFNEIVNYIYTEANARMQKPGKCYINGNQSLAFAPPIYKEMIIYLRLCLMQSVELPFTREIMRHPTEHSPIIGTYLSSLYRESDPVEKSPLLQYLFLTKKLLRASPAIEPLCCVLEVVGCVPKLHVMLLEDLQWIRDLLNSTKEEIRENACVLYAILIANGSSEASFDRTIKDLVTASENSKHLEAQHGSLLGAANCVERRIIVKNMDVVAWDAYKTSVHKIDSFLTHNSAMMVGAACVSVGLIGRCAPLPFPNDKCEKNATTKLTLVNKLLEIMNNGKFPAKIRERAAKSLGLICVGEIFPYTKEVIEGLLKTAKDTKDVEMHFTVGESLLMCVQSVWSQEARDAWKTLPADHSPRNPALQAPPDENMTWLVAELLKYVAIPHPNSRQASCIWLLTLLKRCADREPIKTRLSDIQRAFMDLLSENNEIVVDVASKGLGLVFDSSESDVGSALLRQLVDQLQSGRKSIPEVTGETKLFEEGELGKSPTGGNLSTYKELCSLASDLNKPDLIYKFMQLANHNTIWNSKKGAAFGFLTIASKAGEQLKPHLPKIIPRLYRYRFDPTPNLQHSMDRIWHALVPETQKTVDLYYKEILADIVTNMTVPQWRVRQSCCLALQDFIRGGTSRPIHDAVDSIPQLWAELFRVMDDVHEPTRVVSTSTARIFSKICVRACDVAHGKDGDRMLQALLPVMLKNGAVSPVGVVRAASLLTIAHLIDSASGLLKPFLPQLLPALLYASGELASYGLDAEYVTVAMRKSLQYADASILPELVPKVLDLMRSNLPVGTKLACANFVTLLTVQLGQDLQPYTGKFLVILVNGLVDRNADVRKQYANSIGHLVSTAKPSSLENLYGKFHTWYFDREEEVSRLSCAYTIQSISRQNPDALKAHAHIVIPLVFLGMHAGAATAESPPEVPLWEEVWGEMSNGTETGIRKHLEEICKMLKTGITSPSWNMKAQSANGICTVASKLGANFEPKQMTEILDMLVAGLAGRTWNGKHKLLMAIAAISKNCKQTLKANPEFDLNELVDNVMKETKKENVVYRRQALETLGDMLAALEMDRFADLYSNVQNILSKESTEGGDALTSEESNQKQEDLIKLKETMYETIGKAWPTNVATQEMYGETIAEHCAKCLPNTTRAVQVSVVAALYKFVDKLAVFGDEPVSDEHEQIFQRILQNVFDALTYSLSIPKHTRLRKESLNVVLSLAKGFKAKGRADDLKKLSAKWEEVLPLMEKDQQPEVRSRVSDIKNLLKATDN